MSFSLNMNITFDVDTMTLIYGIMVLHSFLQNKAVNIIYSNNCIIFSLNNLIIFLKIANVTFNQNQSPRSP